MTKAAAPIALAHLGPTITVVEAAHRTCGRDMPRNHSLGLRAKADGSEEMLWKVGEQWVSSEEYEATGKALTARYRVATHILLDALRGGDVQAYAGTAQQGVCYHVPHHYWNRFEYLSDGPVDAEGIDGCGTLAGEPIILSGSSFDDWCFGAQDRVAAVMAFRAEPSVEKKTKQTRPKPWWFPMLETEYLRGLDRQRKWSDTRLDAKPPVFPRAADLRRRLLAKNWPEGKTLPRQSVEYHYNALREKYGS